MGAIINDWLEPLKAEFSKEYYKEFNNLLINKDYNINGYNLL